MKILLSSMTGVRSEALEALKGERAVESSNRQGNYEGSSNSTQGSHQPVTAIYEDASRETSIAAMPYLSSGAGSSAFLPSPETNLPNQSLPALTNMPRPLNAEEGEPDTEVPQGEGGPDTEVPQGEGGPDTEVPQGEGGPDTEIPQGEGGPDIEVPQGEMPRAMDPFSELVEEKPNNKRKCDYCGNEYVGGGKRIKVHFAGVRSEALEALKGERAVESSNRQGNDEGSSNLTQGWHQPVTVGNEDASRETSITAMPYLSSRAGSSASLPSPEMSLPYQSVPALTDMPRPLNAEEGEPDTEVPQGEMPIATDAFLELVGVLPNYKLKGNFFGDEYVGGVKRIKAHFARVGGCGIRGRQIFDDRVRSEGPEALNGERAAELSNRQGNDEGSSDLTHGLHQPVNASNEDASRETITAAMPYLCSGAGSSAFLTLPETNQCPPASTNMPRPLNGEEGEPYTEVPNGARKHVALAEIQPGTHRLANTTMTSLKRKLEELVGSGVADMKKLKSKWRGIEEAYRNEVGHAESQPGNHRLADRAMTSPSRKLRALAMSRLADMNKLKSKWRRIKEEYWSVVRAIKEGISFPPEKLAEVEELSKEIEEIFLVLGRVRQEVIALARRCKRSASLTIELVGKEARRKVNVIFSCLMQDTVPIIGVYGMGGVGKTAILGHVYNILHEDLSLDVFWVTVPQDFSVYALQEEIANAVGLDNLSNEKDVKRRAGLLYGHLNVKNRSILILDGLWLHFEVKDVGIPVETGNLKLVVTTRSLEVCSMMPCQKQIKIELLDMEDSSRLFLKTLCIAEGLPKEVEQIAGSLLDRCCGLPLGIIEIATRMRGVEKVLELGGVLGKLEDSWMGLDVFKCLQLSYLNLGNDEVQQCFLHLVLCFGEEEVLSAASREELIESFIDEGLLGGSATRQGLHDRGNAILDKIRRACLLDPGKKHQYLHPLIKDMALHAATRTTHMVKAYMGLKEIPEEVFWTDRLEKVLLQGNKIEEIPCAISPNCPKLTRLSLNDNAMLRVIHESFFKHLKGLTVLDLSDTGITELPNPVCQLESLEALLLRRCDALRFIPYVGKLGSLRKLDLQACGSLEEAPEGMEMLVNLRYLDLDGTGIETLSEGVLGMLVNLQYLAIKMLRAGEEVKSTKVDEVYCSVANVETFNACVGSLERNNCRRYRLAVGAPDWDRLCCVDVDRIERYILIDGCDHIAASVDGTGGDGCALLPEGVQSLELSRCHKMERVMEWEWLMTLLPNLKEIITYCCEKLEEITRGPSPSGATCRLTYIYIDGCNNMKRVLLTQDVLLHLPFLQEISVKDCKGIEVIIGTVAKMMHCSFPKLMKLGLSNLPELKSICDGTMCCDSLRWISIENCPKLKRIPVQLPLLDNGLPSPSPSLKGIRINQQTWESLEWDHPLARSSLEHLVKFLD